jgi:tetratricopeptide repeat protein
MTREQWRFLVSGIVFGFLVGYVVAWGAFVPRVTREAAPVPEAGNLGMTGAVIGPGGGGGGAPGGGAADAAGSGGGEGRDAVMARVVQELAALKQTIEKNPKDLEALVRLGNFYQDAGKFDQAVDYYARALAVDPKQVDARTDRGICLRELGKPDDAIAEFRKSLEIDPRHWQTWLNLGIVSLFDKHDPETAASAFGKVEELKPDYPGLADLKDEVRRARKPA